MKILIRKLPLVSLLLLISWTASLSAESEATSTLKLPGIFGDHMVLQQGQEIPVWGWAEPGSTVRVSLEGQSTTTQADAAGEWVARLPALPASKNPVRLTIESNGESLTFEDILLGDVWLCSGQSNMAMGVGAQKRAKEIIANADHPEIRFFLVHRQVSYSPASDLLGEWVVCSPENITMDGGWKGFSAVGYFFGRAIQQSQNVPVGLIGSYVGGTNIIFWTSAETLAEFPPRSAAQSRLKQFTNAKEELTETRKTYQQELKPAWDKILAERNATHAENIEAWKKASELARSNGQPIPNRPKPGKLPSRPRDPDRNFSLATVLYNGMIHPLAPFPLTGIIWYQGEANAYPGREKEYEENLAAMIEDWRDLWNQGDIPFSLRTIAKSHFLKRYLARPPRITTPCTHHPQHGNGGFHRRRRSR